MSGAFALMEAKRSLAESVPATDTRVSFPSNYKSEFENYLSLDRTGNPDQVIRLFANKTARDAAQAGKPLPSGSVLVGEIYKAKTDEAGNVVTSELGRRVRGKFAAVAVMEKRDGWGAALSEELRNGDWDFGIFSPAGERLAGKDLNSCRSCHAPLKDTQHLFSLEHLSAAP
jgi:hypothetical protein